MAPEEHELPVAVNVSVDESQRMAGFEVSINGRFWVSTEATGRLLFVLVLLAHDRRRIKHVAVTAHPTAAWTAQQLREAFSCDEAPRYLIHDRDHTFDQLAVTAQGMGIEELSQHPVRLGKMHSSSAGSDPSAANASTTSSSSTRGDCIAS